MQGISGVVVSFYDILTSGSTEMDHFKALDEVLSHVEKAGLRVRQKCKFMRTHMWTI